MMGRMHSALRAYVLGTPDPATALRMLDRKIEYFEPDAMATVLDGCTPETGDFTVSSAGHLRPYWPRQADSRACFPRSASAIGPPTTPTAVRHLLHPARRALVLLYDGLVDRRGQVLNQGMDTLAATLGKLVAVVPGATTSR